MVKPYDERTVIERVENIEITLGDLGREQEEMMSLIQSLGIKQE